MSVHPSQVSLKISPMPDSKYNRYFLSSSETRIADDHTKLLYRRYKLNKDWISELEKPEFCPFPTQLRHRPYSALWGSPSKTRIHVQQMSYFVSKVRGVRVSPTHQCIRLKMILEQLLVIFKMDPNENVVIAVKLTDNISPDYLEFDVFHIGHLPLWFGKYGFSYPVLLDYRGFHFATSTQQVNTMEKFIDHFSKDSKKGRCMMSQADRHYLSDGLPSKCLNIQVIGTTSTHSCE